VILTQLFKSVLKEIMDDGAAKWQMMSAGGNLAQTAASVTSPVSKRCLVQFFPQSWLI
jgi:hypothetical protein